MSDSSAIFELPRLHTAIAQWLFCIVYLLPMRKKRFSRPVSIALSFVFFVILAVFNLLGERVNGFAWVMWFILCLGTMLAMFMTLSVSTFPEAVYHWSQAFVAAEFAASLEWQVTYYVLHDLLLNEYYQSVLVSYGILIVVFLSAALILFVLNRKYRAQHSRYHITKKDAASAAIIAVSVFCIGNIPFAFRNSGFAESLQLGVLWMRTMADFSGIVMMEANESRRREINLNYELEATANMMHRQYEQYRMFQANAESLHQIYHDLKHQIEYIRNETNDSSREKYLQQMEDVIHRHEAAIDSGNPVLDTLLINKNFFCIKKGIQMVCFADARLLGFMDAMDICSLFGNAIDNAIECVEKIEDHSKRLIHVTITPKNDMMFISIENCCEENVVIDDNDIKTTKADDMMHGFGLKSIRHTVEKYRGFVSLELAEGWFSLTALIPME